MNKKNNPNIQFEIEKLLHSKREEIIKIANNHGAFNIRIFGSVARGEADEKSDIDFLVDYSLDKISSWFPSGLILDLEKLLDHKIDVATENSLKERIKQKVLQEAIKL
jgi:predicted nucleotidyltransferase